MVFLLLLTAEASWTQSPFRSLIQPPGNQRGGIRLYSVSVHAGYTSQALPQGSYGLFLNNDVRLGPDIQTGAAASLGWSRHREETDFSLSYSGSYDAFLRHPDLSFSNHSVSFSSRTRLSGRWSLSFSSAAGAGSFAQSLFLPTVFSQIAAIPATFEDLSAAMLARRFTNDQLASILTGAPFSAASVIESPARLLLYGNRMFTTSLQSTVSYSHSPRLSLHFGGSASRSQHLDTKGSDEALRSAYRIPHTTAAQASAGLSYSLTPRTQVGVSATSGRTFSLYQDAYITTGTGSLGRTMGRHWFLQARGGAGVISPLRQTFALHRGPQYLAGGTVGLKVAPHTFLASCDRTVGDSYGLGAQSSEVTTAAWNWSRPGQRWTLLSSVSHQRLWGSGLGRLEGWTAGGGATRTLNRHTSVQAQYFHFSNSGTAAGIFQGLSLSGHAVRLTFVWTPAPGGPR